MTETYTILVSNEININKKSILSTITFSFKEELELKMKKLFTENIENLEDNGSISFQYNEGDYINVISSLKKGLVYYISLLKKDYYLLLVKGY